MNEFLFEIREALVAYEILLRGEGNKIGALSLAANEVCVLGSGKMDKAGKVVLAVELKQRLEGGKAGEVEGLGRLEVLDLGSLTFENDLVLLVAGAKCEDSRQVSRYRNGEVSGVAEVVLGLSERRARQW